MRLIAACIAIFIAMPAATMALAAEPPACTDKKILSTVRAQYQFAEGSRPDADALADLANIREVSLGAPPAAANQYATATTFIALSRFCEASAALKSGNADPIYWHIDQARDGASDYIRTDHCSKRHDVFADGCKGFRPGG